MKLLSYFYKLKFITKYNKEIINLIKIKIFNIIDIPPDLFYKDFLFLIQVFKYKTDFNDFII